MERVWSRTGDSGEVLVLVSPFCIPATQPIMISVPHPHQWRAGSAHLHPERLVLIRQNPPDRTILRLVPIPRPLVWIGRRRPAPRPLREVVGLVELCLRAKVGCGRAGGGASGGLGWRGRGRSARGGRSEAEVDSSTLRYERLGSHWRCKSRQSGVPADHEQLPVGQVSGGGGGVRSPGLGARTRRARAAAQQQSQVESACGEDHRLNGRRSFSQPTVSIHVELLELAVLRAPTSAPDRLPTNGLRILA